MNYYPQFASLLNQHLTQLDRPASWLAKKLGVSPSTVTRWRNGESRPKTPEIVVQAADLLGGKQAEWLQAVGYGIQKIDSEQPQRRILRLGDRYENQSISAWTVEDSIPPENLHFPIQRDLPVYPEPRKHSQQIQIVDTFPHTDGNVDDVMHRIRQLAGAYRYTEALEIISRLHTNITDQNEGNVTLATGELNFWSGRLYGAMGQYDKAEQSLKQAIHHLLPLRGHREGIDILAWAYEALGYINRVQGSNHLAVEMYQRALPLWRVQDMLVDEAFTRKNLAFALAEIGSFDKAIPMSISTMPLLSGRGGGSIYEGHSLTTFAAIKARANALDEAVLYAEQALTQFVPIQDDRGQAMTFTNLAEIKRWHSTQIANTQVDIKLSLLEEAITYAQNSITIFQSTVREPVRLAEALIQLGCAYRDCMQLHLADPHHRRRTDSQSPTIPHETAQKLFEQSNYYLTQATEQAHNHKLAYQYFNGLLQLAWLHYDWELSKLHDNYTVLEEQLERRWLRNLESQLLSGYDYHLVLLGDLRILRGQIAFSRYQWSERRDRAALYTAIESFTLAVHTYRQYSEYIYQQMREGLMHVYRCICDLNVQEIIATYETVRQTEAKYGIGQSYMHTFLAENLGPYEDYVALQM